MNLSCDHIKISVWTFATILCLLLAIFLATPQLRTRLYEPNDSVRDVPVHKLHDEYDFIVVGSGPGGATIANRLSENPNWTVLLLEAGGHENIITDIPIIAEFLKETNYNWGYLAQPQPGTACLGMKNGRCPWPRGKALGGTTVINHMLYTRGHTADYDEWDQLGNTGWGWNNFLKSEILTEFHSTGGLLDIETSYTFPITEAFISSALELGMTAVDINSSSAQGFSLPQFTKRNGARCSASKAFLRPAASRTNLHVVMHALVTRILIDNKTVQGVKYLKDGQYRTVRVIREVILSAGVVNTPQLLMLSGIGPREHLLKLGTPVVHHLPGVGQNLQEHVVTPYLTFTVNDSITLVPKRILTDFKSVSDYIFKGTGPLTSSLIDGLVFIQNNNIELIFIPTSLASYNTGFNDDIYETVYAPLYGEDTFSIWPMLMRPHSRGWIQLQSTDPLVPPLIYGNLLTDERDVTMMVEALKFAVQVSRSRALQRYNCTLHATPLPGCTQHQFATVAYWACVVRVMTYSGHHQCCTAKMGPRSDVMAVVDHELKVHGIRGLRVVDASVMPSGTTAHPMATVYMIAEKAADLIKQQHIN